MTVTELWQCPACKTVRAIAISDGYISCNECGETMRLKMDNVKIERDARSELVRLQKETHLAEHGFYDKEIWNFYDENFSLIKEECKDGKIFDTARILWFKQKFPEFFDKKVIEDENKV